MSTAIMEECGKDVVKFMVDFSSQYLLTFVNKKLEDSFDEAVNKVIPEEIIGGDNEDGDGDDDKDDGVNDDNEDGNETAANNDGNDETKDDTKDDAKEDDAGDDDDGDDSGEESKEEAPIAAGAAVIRYKFGVGPDRVEHFYADIAVWSIKPNRSIITKLVDRHSNLHSLKKTLEKKYKSLKKLDMGDVKWPKKKMFGKDKSFYKARFHGIRAWLDALSKIQEVSTSDEFLNYFGLKSDDDDEFLVEIFQETIETICEDDQDINFDKAMCKATRLGLEISKVELLKVIAVEKIGMKHIKQVKKIISEKKALPKKLKDKAIKKTESAIAKVISTGVDTGWKSIEPIFGKVSKAINTGMDKVKDPITKICNKALDPIGKIIKDKFDKTNAKFEVKVSKRTITYERFENIKLFIDSISNGKTCTESIKYLCNSVNELSKTNEYAAYFALNFRLNETIKQFIPFIGDLEDNNFRVAIALTDMVYVCSRSLLRAFTPLFTVVDGLTKQFDKDKVNDSIIEAVRDGGKKLAIDYYTLPITIRKGCRKCGKTITNMILKLTKKTMIKIADLLGSIASKYKPTSKDDAIKKLTDISIPLLNKFLNNRIDAIIKILRKGTQTMISDKLIEKSKDIIDPICKLLNDLVKQLPEPIGNNLKPSKIIYYLIGKAVSNITVLVVNFLCSTVLDNIYNKHSEPKPLDINTVKKLRVPPKISDKDYEEEPENEGHDEDDETHDNPDVGTHAENDAGGNE